MLEVKAVQIITQGTPFRHNGIHECPESFIVVTLQKVNHFMHNEELHLSIYVQTAKETGHREPYG